MEVLDLFSGIGGMSLGLERAGMRTVAFCEIKPYCQKVLRKHWSGVPIYDDIRLLTKDSMQRDGIATVKIVCGGFPCQPFSLAGNQNGSEDDRDLWPEMRRVIEEWQPDWVLGENVANFVNMAFTRSKVDLENLGYIVQPFIIPACAVGALHRRNRVWIVAHHRRLGMDGIRKGSLSWQSPFSWVEDVRGFEDLRERSAIHTPMLCRADDGIPYRMDRLEGLGNSVIPQIPEIIGRCIMQLSRA